MNPSMINLQQWHFLVTRPKAQAEAWKRQLQSLGAQTSCQPMMEIMPLSDQSSERQVINCILAFAEYQKAIFISQNAVNYGVQWLDQYWPQLPIDVEFFAIGRATAELLQKNIGHAGTDAGYLTHSAQSAMNSEALLAHHQLQLINGQKIIIFRGQGGRTLLGDELQKRGAIVDYCELYQRNPPSTSSQSLDREYRHTHRRPVTTVHSGETLTNLCSIIKADDLLWLQQQALLLSGQRVADQARQAGFKQVIVAQNATHESMIKALDEWQ